MKGKGERGGIFSSAFGILLGRRKKFPEVTSQENFGVARNEPCYFHQCRRPDIRRAGGAAAAVMGFTLRRARRGEWWSARGGSKHTRRVGRCRNGANGILRGAELQIPALRRC